MTKQAQSLYVITHEAFWNAIADQYLVDVEHGKVKDAFIGYAIKDWVNDVNTEMSWDTEELIKTWGSFQEYDQWLLRSMLHREEIIHQFVKMFHDNKDEIKEMLGDDDPSYINDFSADFYYTTGIDVPDK